MGKVIFTLAIVSCACAIMAVSCNRRGGSAGSAANSSTDPGSLEDAAKGVVGVLGKVPPGGSALVKTKANEGGGVQRESNLRASVGNAATHEAFFDGAVALQKAGGQVVVNANVEVPVEKKVPQDPALESSAARDARMHWESKQCDYKRACRAVDQNEVNYATPNDPGARNDYTTNCSRTWRFNAKRLMDKAWSEYQEVLREEQQ